MNAIDYKKFYSELGKLLYAVADIDKAITPGEKKALYKMVREHLVPAEPHIDAFGTDAAYYAEFEFDILDDAIIDSETAFLSFMDYIDNHRRLIDEPMRRLCIQLADKLASAYHHKNKKEREFLLEIKNKLLA